MIECIVDFASVNRGRNNSLKSIPRDLVWINVLTIFTHRVKPLINAHKCAPLVSFIEFVEFRPTNRSKSKPLLNHGVEPSHDKVETFALHRRGVTFLSCNS